MTTTAPTAGWYADPLNPDAHRYWDGTGWTEHTSPGVAAAPQAPAQQAPVQQSPVQQEPVQQHQYAAPSQYAGPAQPTVPRPSTETQPYAYVVPAARTPHGQATSLYAPPRPSSSTATKVLIGVAIAVGGFVLLGILASIAIPVFLNQRAKAVTVVMPDTVDGLVRSNSAQAQQITQQWMTLPVPGTKSIGVYDDSSGRPHAAILAARVDMTDAQQTDFFQGATSGAARTGLGALHDVDLGSLSGHMQCAPLQKATATVCVFADDKVGGVIDIIGTSTGDSEAVQLRKAVEHRS